MGLTLQDAAETGRAAWLANLTVAEKVWPIRQLHALYRLLLENRDELLEVCNQGIPTDLPTVGSPSSQTRSSTDFSPGPLFWEKELATLVDDIGALILSIEAQANPTAPQDTHFGKITTFAQPCGVSLILSTSRNPLRLALAPLAASIAARNVVVLSTTNRDGFWALLEQKAADYLDTFAIQVVGATVSEIRPEKFDQIHIIGESPTACRFAWIYGRVLSTDSSAEEDDKQKYSELCQFSHVNWHPASGSFNVAVVDDGPLDVARCAHEISSNLPNLTAIMIEKGHFQSLCDALCKSIRRDSSQTETPTLDLPNGHHLTSIVYTVDWTGSAAVYSAADVQSMLQSAQRAGAVLMIKLSSMEQCLDVLRHTARIAQASLLNPKSREHERYFQDWTQSSTVAFGFIPSPIPEGKYHHPIQYTSRCAR